MFELIIADSDTPLFTAAKSVQQDYILVTMPWGEIKEFPNVTALWGNFHKKAGGWLADYNFEMMSQFEDDELDSSESSHYPLKPEDLIVEQCTRLHPDIQDGDHLAEAEKQFDFFVGSLKKRKLAKDYLLAIGGKGNYRYAAATLQQYKGKRKPKPLLFSELHDLISHKYRKRLVVCDGQEADDYCGIRGWENYLHWKKTQTWKYVLAYIDKDLDMIISPSINYSENKPVRYPNPFDCAKAFATQLLCGDKSTDNIPGLPNYTSAICEKYQIRACRGIGKATAEELLRTCTTIKCLFERVVEAYRSYYGNKQHIVNHWETNEELQWEWIDFMQENGLLLYMKRTHNDVFNVREFLDRLGIEYGKE